MSKLRSNRHWIRALGMLAFGCLVGCKTEASEQPKHEPGAGAGGAADSVDGSGGNDDQPTNGGAGGSGGNAGATSAGGKGNDGGKSGAGAGAGGATAIGPALSSVTSAFYLGHNLDVQPAGTGWHMITNASGRLTFLDFAELPPRKDTATAFPASSTVDNVEARFGRILEDQVAVAADGLELYDASDWTAPELIAKSKPFEDGTFPVGFAVSGTRYFVTLRDTSASPNTYTTRRYLLEGTDILPEDTLLETEEEHSVAYAKDDVALITYQDGIAWIRATDGEEVLDRAGAGELVDVVGSGDLTFVLQKNGLDGDVQVAKVDGPKVEVLASATFPIADRMAAEGDRIYVFESLYSMPKLRTVHFDGKALSTVRRNPYGPFNAPDALLADAPYLIVGGSLTGSSSLSRLDWTRTDEPAAE